MNNFLSALIFLFRSTQIRCYKVITSHPQKLCFSFVFFFFFLALSLDLKLWNDLPDLGGGDPWCYLSPCLSALSLLPQRAEQEEVDPGEELFYSGSPPSFGFDCLPWFVSLGGLSRRHWGHAPIPSESYQTSLQCGQIFSAACQLWEGKRGSHSHLHEPVGSSLGVPALASVQGGRQKTKISASHWICAAALLTTFADELKRTAKRGA